MKNASIYKLSSKIISNKKNPSRESTRCIKICNKNENLPIAETPNNRRTHTMLN